LLDREGVLCRIQVTHDNNRVVVRLAGHLTGAQVPDLLAVCAEGDGHPRVELEELMSADAIGLDALLRVQDEGAQLVGLLEYLQFELDTVRRRRM
jgi:hypothetical protein